MPSVEPTDWRATERDWKLLENTRHRRGWQLAALSVGATPKRGVVRLMPEHAARQYRDYLSIIRNSATKVRSTSKLQRENSIAYQGRASNPDDPSDWSFDVLKFVTFFNGLPSAPVDARMIAAAEHWRSREANDQVPQAIPDRVANAALARIEGSLLDILLGLAMHHYGYLPLGLAPTSKSAASHQTTYVEMSSDLESNGVSVSAWVIQKRLAEASARLRDREKARDSVMAKLRPVSGDPSGKP